MCQLGPQAVSLTSLFQKTRTRTHRVCSVYMCKLLIIVRHWHGNNHYISDSLIVNLSIFYGAHKMTDTHIHTHPVQTQTLTGEHTHTLLVNWQPPGWGDLVQETSRRQGAILCFIQSGICSIFCVKSPLQWSRRHLCQQRLRESRM